MRWESGSSPQQFTYFLITCLRKIFIPLADTPKWLRCDRANHLVRHGLQLRASIRRSHRHRNHDLGRPFLLECEDGDPHRRTCRQTIVDQNYCLPAHVDRRTPVAVFAFSTFQFALLFLRYLVEYTVKR